MLRYEVIVQVREDLQGAFERYFIARHIPEILATGCFLDIRFERADSGAFRTVYHAATRADLDRYLTEHTARFRADLGRDFPEGITASRENWTVIKAWKA